MVSSVPSLALLVVSWLFVANAQDAPANGLIDSYEFYRVRVKPYSDEFYELTDGEDDYDSEYYYYDDDNTAERAERSKKQAWLRKMERTFFELDTFEDEDDFYRLLVDLYERGKLELTEEQMVEEIEMWKVKHPIRDAAAEEFVRKMYEQRGLVPPTVPPKKEVPAILKQFLKGEEQVADVDESVDERSVAPVESVEEVSERPVFKMPKLERAKGRRMNKSGRRGEERFRRMKEHRRDRRNKREHEQEPESAADVYRHDDADEAFIAEMYRRRGLPVPKRKLRRVRKPTTTTTTTSTTTTTTTTPEPTTTTTEPTTERQRARKNRRGNRRKRPRLDERFDFTYPPEEVEFHQNLAREMKRRRMIARQKKLEEERQRESDERYWAKFDAEEEERKRIEEEEERKKWEEEEERRRKLEAERFQRHQEADRIAEEEETRRHQESVQMAREEETRRQQESVQMAREEETRRQQESVQMAREEAREEIDNLEQHHVDLDDEEFQRQVAEDERRYQEEIRRHKLAVGYKLPDEFDEANYDNSAPLHSMESPIEHGELNVPYYYNEHMENNVPRVPQPPADLPEYEPVNTGGAKRRRGLGDEDVMNSEELGRAIYEYEEPLSEAVESLETLVWRARERASRGERLSDRTMELLLSSAAQDSYERRHSKPERRHVPNAFRNEQQIIRQRPVEVERVVVKQEAEQKSEDLFDALFGKPEVKVAPSRPPSTTTPTTTFTTTTTTTPIPTTTTTTTTPIPTTTKTVKKSGLEGPDDDYYYYDEVIEFDEDFEVPHNEPERKETKNAILVKEVISDDKGVRHIDVHPKPTQLGRCSLYLNFDNDFADYSPNKFGTKTIGNVEIDKSLFHRGSGSAFFNGGRVEIGSEFNKNLFGNTPTSFCVNYRCADYGDKFSNSCSDVRGALLTNGASVREEYSVNLMLDGNTRSASIRSIVSQLVVSSTTQLNPEPWHQMCVTYDGKMMQLFEDGQPLQTVSSEHSKRAAIKNVKTPFSIGSGRVIDGSFIGLMDDVLVCPFKMTESDMAAHRSASDGAMVEAGLVSQ